MDDDLTRDRERAEDKLGGNVGTGSRFKSALRTLLQKRRVESELDMEIRSYVDAVTDEKIASGISPSEARRQALAESGGLEQVKQAVRDQRASTVAESVVQDIRYGLRQMRHNPRLPGQR